MNIAYLKKDSPFYAIFPRGEAPVINWLLPTKVRLDGCDETDAYLLDTSQCTSQQLDQIAALVAEKFKADPVVVLQEILAKGIPIRASQVTGTSSVSRSFL